jgi:hypothetical protein
MIGSEAFSGARLNRLRFAFVLVMAVFVLRNTPVGATQYCDPDCTYSTPCTDYCLDVGNVQTTCGNYGGGLYSGMCSGTCGDGYCNLANGEGVQNDPNDCPQDCFPDLLPPQPCTSNCNTMPGYEPGLECNSAGCNLGHTWCTADSYYMCGGSNFDICIIPPGGYGWCANSQ